ncbi:hypothetical protein BS17DRAFT_790166, partial [Gyrodon lividus]
MQFKLTTAFILIGTVLAIVHAAPTSDATWHSDPAVNAGPDIDFVYPPRAVPEATDTEAANPDIIFSYPPRLRTQTSFSPTRRVLYPRRRRDAWTAKP